ncbi:MAG: dihydroorotate dehydrogenase electron transfer subunit PyrK [Marinimicrobia bacterium 46_43]|nr:MAG: dihydroorotate dehydrogenase electron transfer subunit PyrK [Marinimicrobia bacterium 46_43]
MSDQMKTYPVLNIKSHSPVMKSFYFRQPEPDIQPGRFFNVWLPGVDEKPFSVSDVFQGIMEITVKAVGPFTRKLMDVRRGDLLGLRGPFGRGFSHYQHALLVGGGMGIVPLRYLARQLRQRGFHFEVLLGGRCRQDISFQTDFSDYSSGPEAMLVKVMDLAAQAGLDYEISFERYMKCGIGICGQCVVDGSGIRLCKEGPVLSRQEAEKVSEWGMPHRDATGRRNNS